MYETSACAWFSRFYMFIFALDIYPYRSSIVSPFLWRRILYDSSEIQKSGENVESMY